MTQGNHPCFIVASLLDGVNNMVYFHAKYGMVTDDGSITNDIDMGMLTRKLWWWWLIIWLYVVERMMDDHFLRMLSWLSWWKICFHQHWTMQTPRKISKRWWLVVGWTEAWEMMPGKMQQLNGGYTTQVMASFIGKMMWNQWTIGSTVVSGKPKNGCGYLNCA